MAKTGRKRKKDYCPSPEDIIKECGLIQAGWSSIERRRRSAYLGGGRVQLKTAKHPGGVKETFNVDEFPFSPYLDGNEKAKPGRKPKPRPYGQPFTTQSAKKRQVKKHK